ncbi:ShlB/FhaC/HecB family hemolysin secretion/activation protein [bacterium]|nr:ShlB/FhaC/HecB family hemolysin secretion/activation protein [bacterium]
MRGWIGGGITCWLGISCAWVGPVYAQPGGTPDNVPATNSSEVSRIRVERFVLPEFGSMLSNEEAQRIVAPFQGQALSLGEVQKAADALTAELKNRGYFLARVLVPVQQLENGQVRLEVLNGSIGQISVEGNEYYSSEFIRGFVEDGLGPDRTMTEADLQRKLLLLNENSDLKVTAYLQPGRGAGQADLSLQTEDSLPLHGGIGYDNFGTTFTNVHRLTPHLEVGNLVQDGDNLTVRYLFGLPDNRSSFLQTSYSTPVDNDGTRLSFSYANGASTLGQQLEVLDIRGRANIYSASLYRPLVRTITQSQDLLVTYSYKDLNNTLLGTPTGKDRYHSLRLGYVGNFADDDGRLLIQAAVTQGLAGSRLDDSFARPGVRVGFTKLNLDTARIQNFSDSFYLFLRAGGQWSPSPLFTAEQYALGGIDSVRGYNQAQFLGDQGYSVSAELRWLPFEERRDVQFSAFLDHGGARLLQPQPGTTSSANLTGAGLGVRFDVGAAAQLRLDVGWPLSPGNNASGDKPVFYGQVYTHF